MPGLKIPNNARLRTAAAIYKFDDIEFVNKDYFIVQLLKALQDLPKDGFYFVFAGGTCLSKAFNLIKRMSEDVDLRVIFTTLPASRNALKKKLSEVKHLLEAVDKCLHSTLLLSLVYFLGVYWVRQASAPGFE